MQRKIPQNFNYNNIHKPKFNVRSTAWTKPFKINVHRGIIGK